jgi:phosphatidylserine/phosphatidylglycerophosphate/cardiolipin synthase-like enzyme
LHDKALAADDFVIAGSMNFTFSGAMLNEEQVQLHTDPAYVAATQIDLHQRFGGVLR